MERSFELTYGFATNQQKHTVKPEIHRMFPKQMKRNRSHLGNQSILALCICQYKTLLFHLALLKGA